MFMLFKFGFSLFPIQKTVGSKSSIHFFAHNSDIVCGGSFTVKAVDRQRRATEVQTSSTMQGKNIAFSCSFYFLFSSLGSCLLAG